MIKSVFGKTMKILEIVEILNLLQTMKEERNLLKNLIIMHANDLMIILWLLK